MLSRLTKVQLVMFAVITVGALLIMALNYVRLPAQLGFGRFDVTMELENAGGLYPKSDVTYRGTEVGQVTSLEVRPGGGVLVHMQIDDGARIPADAQALVRSASVIGEQYVDFVPGAKSSDQVLAGGSVIKEARTDLPTTTDEVLSSVDTLLKSIPTADLEKTLDELDAAFAGSGEDLGTLISSSSEFVEAANDNLDETVSLINSAGPVLQTQKDMDPNIRAFVGSLDTVTGELAKNTDNLRTIFAGSDRFLGEIRDWADAMDPVFAKTLADTARIGAVAKAYDPAIQHILAIVPALQTMFIAALPESRRDDPLPSINLQLRAGFDPPVCTTGFPSPNRFRDPDDPKLLPPPADAYCKVAPDSPMVVRGARNAPCPNGPKRGPYASSCGLVFDPAAVARQNAQIAAGDEPNASFEGKKPEQVPDFLMGLLSSGAEGGVDTLEQLLSAGLR